MNTFTINMKQLICKLCKDYINNPIYTKCNHLFCGLCINNWIKINKECPICKSKITNKLKYSYELDYFLKNNLNIKCKTEGCPKYDFYGQTRHNCLYQNRKIYQHPKILQIKKRICKLCDLTYSGKHQCKYNIIKCTKCNFHNDKRLFDEHYYRKHDNSGHLMSYPMDGKSYLILTDMQNLDQIIKKELYLDKQDYKLVNTPKKYKIIIGEIYKNHIIKIKKTSKYIYVNPKDTIKNVKILIKLKYNLKHFNIFYDNKLLLDDNKINKIEYIDLSF